MFSKFKYLHQVDEIIVIKNGEITENGTFKQLMSNRGHLARLVGEHVQIIEPIVEHDLAAQMSSTEQDSLSPYRRPSIIDPSKLNIMTNSLKRNSFIPVKSGLAVGDNLSL